LLSGEFGDIATSSNPGFTARFSPGSAGFDVCPKDGRRWRGAISRMSSDIWRSLCIRLLDKPDKGGLLPAQFPVSKYLPKFGTRRIEGIGGRIQRSRFTV